MTLTHVLSGAAAATAALFLVELIVKGTLVLALAAVLVLALRRASAAHRHLVWACALIGLVALPWMQLALPKWRVTTPLAGQITPGFGLLATTVEPHDERVTPTDTPVFHTLAPSPARTDEFEKLGTTKALEAGKRDAGAKPAAGDARAATASEAARDTARPTPPGTRVLGWILLVWMIGALAVLATFISGHFVLRLMLHGARPVRDGEWHALALEAADRLGLTLPFSLLRADGILVPVASGLLRPRVLLPEGADAWPLELRRAVLLHELAHVQRHDCLTQAIAQVACALFWFHPGVWFATSRLQVERERACDDRVLAARTRASDYADHLLEVVRTLRAKRLSALGAVAFARPSSLEGRLLAVLDPLRNRRAVGRGAALAAALVAALLVLPFAAFEPVAAGTTAMGSLNARSGKVLSDPDALKPSRVVAVPEPGQPLEQRLAWARSDAGKSGARAWWVGWPFESSASLKGGLLCDSEGIRMEELGRSGWFTMEDILVGRAQGTSDPKRTEATDDQDHRPAMMLIRMESGAPGRVRIQTAELPVDFGGEPLYWVDAVQDEQVFRWLAAAAEKADDLALRARLVESVGFLGNSDLVVPYLTKTFQTSTSDRVRRSAVEALAFHPSGEGVQLLTNAAYNDPSPSVRRTSVESLGRFRTQEALEALIAIAGQTDGSDGARRAAFDALGQKVSEQAPQPSTAQVASGEDSKAPKAKPPAKSSPPPADKFATPEMKAKADKSPQKPAEPAARDEQSEPMAREDYEVQRQAIESLGRYPEAQSLPRLKTIAETSPNEDLRAQAVESIGRLGSPAAMALLDDIAWKNRSERARMEAVESMGRRLPPDQALEKLSRIADTHPDTDTRRVAVEAIGRVESPRAHETLAKFVNNGSDVEVGRQAVESLGRRGEPGVENELLAIVRSQAPDEVRRQAVESLGRRDGTEISNQLLEIARTNSSVEVRREAVESLGRRSDPGTTDLLVKIAREDGPEEVQREAVETLGRHGDSSTRELLLEIASKHPSVQVQRQAVESLGRLDQGAGGDVMADLASIARSHPSGEVRRQAVESMTRRDPERALPLLEEILNKKK